MNGLLSDPYVLWFFLIFIILIVVAYKTFKFLAKAFIIGLLASLFPIAGSLLGLNIQVSLGNMLWFGVSGIALFLLYSLVRAGWKFIRLLGKPFRWLLRSRKKESSQKG